MILWLNNKDSIIAEQIEILQKQAYEVEAEIIGFHDIPMLKETTEDIKRCTERFYGCYDENILVGLISYKVEGSVLDIYRVAVNPGHFKKGIGKRLITFVEEINEDVKEIIVATGLKNEPAKRLYLKLGFKENGINEVEKDFCMQSFLKVIEKQVK